MTETDDRASDRDDRCMSRIAAWEGDQTGVPCQKQLGHEGDHVMHNLGLTVTWR